jgi:hypothetical protein
MLFNLNFGFGAADDSIKVKDTDEDGVNDDFEAYNKRNIEVDIEAHEIIVNSIRRIDSNKDQVTTYITYDADGIEFQVNYKSKPESESNLLYRFSYRELIEFVDLDSNGIYNPEIDQNVQNVSLKEFSSAFYEITSISPDTDLHYIKIQTENETFTLHIYFAEEFTILENSLITSAQTRIDIEISNFDYINDSSQLALNIRLDSESEFEIKEVTEDEKNGYATFETGIITTISDTNGYLSWCDNGIVDSVTNPVLLSEVLEDKSSENSQIYLNYQKGSETYHCSKFGIEGLLLKEALSPTTILVISIIVGAVSAVAIYSVYIYKKDHPEKIEKKKEMLKSQNRDNLFDSKIALKMLEEGTDLEALYTKGDINITTISEDFYETIDRLNLKGNERKEFIKEMLSLSPYEREQFLRDMLIQSE